jgi:uncharacterized protein with NRDE domain
VCTLILAWQVFEDAPIAVAANRDELLDRPARPPAVVEESPRVVAPRDEEAGGTWLGYNEHDLLVAITNRWMRHPTDGERSRGLLVRDALRQESAWDARTLVRAELGAKTYQPFHLVLADREDCFLLAWDGRLRVREFDPGVHVVVNVGWDGDYFVPEQRPEIGVEQAAAADRIRHEIEPREGETAAEWTDRARAILADHEWGRCIHEDDFGTRSSSVIRLGEDAVFEHADGPPCVTPFRRVDVEETGDEEGEV